MSNRGKHRVEQDRFQNRGNWIQTLGGLTVLLVIPVLTVLCLSPDFHAWLWASLSAHVPSAKAREETGSNSTSERIRQYRLPAAISKIAEISQEEPDRIDANSASPSGFSRSMLRLRHALEAYPGSNTKDVFRAANTLESEAKTPPCPFEQIDGEQSMALGKDEHGNVFLAKTLSRCAEAVERLEMRRRSAH